MRRQLSVALAATLAIFALSAVSQEESAPTERDVGPVEEIVTIGTRVAGRTATESTVAVDVIGPSDLSRPTGLFETGEMLQRLAPSFNFSRTQISDGADIFRPATLRGLGPDQVLVLINGKRRHNRALLGLSGTVGEGASGTDFNAIPSMALKQIQILRDGAAAQYGSDAIAGVVNLELKDSVNEFSANAMLGQTYDGDGERFQVQVNGGVALRDEGFLNLTGEYREGDPTNRAAESPQFPGTQVFQHGDADTDFIGVFGNSALPLTDTIELYAFGGYSESEALGAGFYRFADQADRSVPQVFPEGFLPRDTNESTDHSIAGGVRGDISSDWQFDLSVVNGKNEYDFGAENTINASIAADFLNQNPDATDAEVAENAGPTEGFSGRQSFEQTTVNVDFTGQLDVGLDDLLYVAVGAEYRDEQYDLVPGELLSFSCGLSPENAFIPSILDPEVPATCGFQGFPGFRPESAVSSSRDSFAFYVDLESNLTDDLLVGIAGRYEDYGSIGDEFTGKLSARYQVAPAFAVRGAIQNGFRAPSLQQLSLEFVTTTVGAGGLTETLLARTGSEFPRLLGVEQLDIETSQSFSGGIIWEPLDNLTITADAYIINIDDRIILGAPLEPQDLDSVPEAQAFLVDNLIGQANFFSNSIDTRTRGLDIVINQGSDVLGGWLNTTLAVSLNDTDVQSIDPPEGIDPRLVFPEPSQRFIEDGQPKERINLSFDWERGPLAALLRFNYLGKTKSSFFTKQGQGIPAEAPTPFNNDPFLSPGSALLVDMETSYAITDNMRLALGGNNLLNEKPDRLAEDSFIGFITRGNLQFPMRALPYGMNGGFYYAQLSVNF